MSTREEQLQRLRRFNELVQQSDSKLAEESLDLGRGVQLEALTPGDTVENAVALESIALRRMRPVLPIKHNETQLAFVDQADSEIWKQRLIKARPLLEPAIRAVGRVELKGGALDWVGTGWLVDETIVITNRHVAREFATRSGDTFTFQVGADGPIAADLDFLQEIDNPETLVFKLVRPLHIEDPPGPDVAFFEIEMVSGNAKLAAPIALATEVRKTENVAAIGYPAYDSRIPEPDLMERIFGRTYNKKRLAPGAVTAVEETRLFHNCTTLGGNSGSVVIDLDSGQALGLHFSGSFLTTNYAVPAEVVRKVLDEVRAGRALRREASQRRPLPGPPSRARPAPPRFTGGASTSVTIPLTMTVSLGDARVSATTPRGPRMPFAVRPSTEPDDIDETEAVASDYRDRRGYDPHFLGRAEALRVDLPSVERGAADIIEFELDDQTETELRYEHFSVVMNRPRRMCFFSAVNIDGKRARKSKRVAWKWDPRVPKAQQIMKECYGDPPHFSRGHMTRREDPGWGDERTAKRGNEDSMHVTNVTPQMQAFNSPIWLALEDYALAHAKEDEMKISVFTGPYLENDDPEMYGVQIPRAFWKIIAFVHDDTGELCATGYEMNQEQNLQPAEEFVFGQFISPQLNMATQVPIRTIEARAGISFGRLASFDPLTGQEESLAGAGPVPLLALEQIRFI